MLSIFLWKKIVTFSSKIPSDDLENNVRYFFFVKAHCGLFILVNYNPLVFIKKMVYVFPFWTNLGFFIDSVNKWAFQNGLYFFFHVLNYTSKKIPEILKYFIPGEPFTATPFQQLPPLLLEIANIRWGP